MIYTNLIQINGKFHQGLGSKAIFESKTIHKTRSPHIHKDQPIGACSMPKGGGNLPKIVPYQIIVYQLIEVCSMIRIPSKFCNMLNVTKLETCWRRKNPTQHTCLGPPPAKIWVFPTTWANAGPLKVGHIPVPVPFVENEALRVFTELTVGCGKKINRSFKHNLIISWQEWEHVGNVLVINLYLCLTGFFGRFVPFYRIAIL